MRMGLALASILVGWSAYAEPALIGGRPADPKDWPASVYASMSGARCSATVVGERVLYIAAHCVANGGTASFSVGPNRYSSKCTHSPKYRRNSTADWALCHVDRVVTGTPYEMVNTNPDLVKVGDEVLLTGYGCIRAGGGGGNDGVYRIGEARVTGTPRGTSNDIVTRGGAALCYGDSGGPAFKLLGAKRVLISINSRGNIRDTSYLSSVSTPDALAFARSWSESKDVKICGLHPNAKGCRDGIEPQLPEECQNMRGFLEHWGQCLTAVPAPEETLCDQTHAKMVSCFEVRYP